MKRGQLKLSFGMIFSIILIVIFIGTAFFAINKFLDLQETVQVGKFATDFQADIKKIWDGSQGSEQREYTLPKKVQKVCLIDYPSEAKGKDSNLYKEFEQVFFETENMFFYPIGSAQGLDSRNMKYVDLEKITETNNPFCIENINGKVKPIIKKNFGEALVTIE